MTPVSKSPLNPLQKALVTLLSADASLTSLLGAAGHVLDQVTEQTAYPYLRLGDHLSIPDNDHGGYGRQVTETLHIWTEARGNVTGQAIANRVIELLDHQHVALTAAFAAPAAHRVVSIRNDFDQALTDPDPEIRHHVLRFRVVTAQLT